jgi:hypothetical protein
VTVYRVTLQPNVRKAIDREIDAALPTLKKGGETGGWLWSPQGEGWWGFDGIDVQEASGPGPDAVYGYRELTLGTGYMHDLDELFRREGLELCGGWHCHPSGNDAPSSVDMERIGKVLELRSLWGSRTRRALEIVFTPPAYRGGAWKPHPWVFYDGESRIGKVPGPQPEAAIVVRGG